ncbi:hypothetical protein JT358_11450 [Micrococcales bacterium 31B]|nr:hypothetical protein [Micrococcales bacterium 31B]
MTTTLQKPAPSASNALDPRSFNGASFAKLTLIEMRKSLNTRSGRSIVIICAALVLLVAVIAYFNDTVTRPAEFSEYVGYMPMPAVQIFPVIAIMGMTAEWSARAALVTFTLSPSRAKVLAAKIVGSIVLGALMYAFSVLVTIGYTALKGATSGFGMTFANAGEALASGGLTFLISVLFGIALGACIANTAGAIVLYFLVPIAISIVFGIANGFQVDWLITTIDYINWQINTAMIAAREFSGHEAQIAVTAAVYVVIPLIIGIFMTMKREVK